MSARTVWLASYPKSGNTWLRAIVTALATHRHLFGVDHLGAGAQPHSVAASLVAYGLDSRWLDVDENLRLRDALIRRWDAVESPELPDAPGSRGPLGAPGGPDPAAPLLRKTHEIHRAGRPGSEPFPAGATRAAIFIARDPRDVACSYADFFGVGTDDAIDRMGTARQPDAGRPSEAVTAQPWGSWSTHAASWLDPSVPFPVHLVRYEDLRADASAVLGPVFAAVGLEHTATELADAIERTRFERLQSSEAERGFRETSRKTTTFFRRGIDGGWRDELTDRQVAAIEADHGQMMLRLGYELVTRPEPRMALAEARASVRRSALRPWTSLPQHLGLNVKEGPVPQSLPHSVEPRPGIQVNGTSTLVRFSDDMAVLVSGGRDVTVQWNHETTEPNADSSWVLQGWAVTIAMLQRGHLSLHAATIRIGDEVVAVAGRRGAGKSTTAMGLRARGHELLVDDVTLVEFRGEESWTTPFARNVHLLPDAAAAVGVDFGALPMLAGGRRKAAFRPEVPSVESVRIDRVVVLIPQPEGCAVERSATRGAERVRVLRQHAHRDGIAPAILGERTYFTQLARLAHTTVVQVLRRPASAWTLDEVLDAIESDLGR